MKKTTCILNLCLCIFLLSCSQAPKQASNNRIIDKESDRFFFINMNFENLSPEPFDAIANRPDIGIFNRPYVDTRVNCIYNKEQGKLHLLKQPIPKTLGLQNDIDNGFVFWPDIISSDGKEMIMFYEADKFLEDYAKLKNPSDEITKVAKSLIEDDNPVAIIAKFKKISNFVTKS